jgi:hypothetical protein
MHVHLFTNFVFMCIFALMCASAYYVVHKLITFMRATIHLKRHDHPIQNDMCKESLDVATLALGSRPRQGLARLRAKREA